MIESEAFTSNNAMRIPGRKKTSFESVLSSTHHFTVAQETETKNSKMISTQSNTAPVDPGGCPAPRSVVGTYA